MKQMNAKITLCTCILSISENLTKEVHKFSISRPILAPPPIGGAQVKMLLGSPFQAEFKTVVLWFISYCWLTLRHYMYIWCRESFRETSSLWEIITLRQKEISTQFKLFWVGLKSSFATVYYTDNCTHNYALVFSV